MPMSTKFLFITALLFFFSWRKVADGFLLFCALFAAALCICVFLYHLDNAGRIFEEDNE